jgi:uncharacterized phiE125 gp8 family phage protein
LWAGPALAAGAALVGSLRLVSGSTELPLTLAQVKAHLRVDFTDDDSLIQIYLAAATSYAESFMGVALIDQTWDYYFDAFPTDSAPIQLPRSPLIEVMEFVGEDVPLSDYLVDYATLPGRVYLTSTGAWPTVYGVTNVGRIRFRAGYVDKQGSPTGEIPSDILSAILLIVGTLYAHRETIVVGQSPASLPWSAEQLLRRHRVETSMA